MKSMQKPVYIISFDRKRQKSYFFARRKNHHTHIDCAKITPLTDTGTGRSARCRGGRPQNLNETVREGLQNFFKKGIDFAGQTRYNVELYENNGKGDATHAQH